MMETLKNILEEKLSQACLDYIDKGTKVIPEIEKILGVTFNQDQEWDITCILATFSREWDDAECDEEGASDEQNKELDRITKKAVSEIIKIGAGK